MAEPPTSPSANPRPTPEHLRDAYLRTEVWIVVDDDLYAADEAVELLPPPVFVITAANPYSKVRTNVQNAAANDELAAVLGALDGTVFEAIGESPDGNWAEASFAVTGVGRRRMLGLGRRFGQEAIFELTRDQLIVRGCATTWQRSRPLVPARDEQGDAAQGDDLATAIEAVFGFVVRPTFARASFPGWTYEGNTGITCPACGGALHLFGNSLRSTKGQPYWAMAVVCAQEHVARLPFEHVRELDALKSFRRLALARRDARARSNDDGQQYSVYVVELAEGVGPRTGSLPWVYVGQTALTPEERFAQHLAGHKSSRWVHHHGVRLRPDLTEGLPPLPTQAAALACEAYLADRLRLEGYPVKGGH